MVPLTTKKSSSSCFGMMPIEFAVEFGDFDLHIVDVTGDFGRPMVGEAGEGVSEVYFFDRGWVVHDFGLPIGCGESGLCGGMGIIKGGR